MEVNYIVLLYALVIYLPSFMHAQSLQDNLRFSSNQNDYDLVNSSEINWRFKRGDVENRDETCLNFDSTAESFFDYFILSVYWPPGLGYLYLTDKNKIRLNLANQKHWSIHGLWPSVINGEVPDKCHDLTQKFKFSVVHIKLAKDNLYGVLTNNWFNIVDMENPSSGIENFWRTEYDNHGACASHAQSIQDDVGYFRTAIKMLNDMSLATKIRESGLSDGGSILLGTLYDKLTQSIGAKLKIIPAFDKERGNYYLTEIRTCYNLNLRLIDCPNYSGPSKSSRSYSINLFSSVPKLKSPTSSKRFQRLKRDSNVTNVSNVIPTFST